MTGRVSVLIDKVEEVLSGSPESPRMFLNTLLNLLRKRDDETYEAGLDALVKSGREMQKDPALEWGSELLLSEAEIASDFPKLTKPEAVELEDYFVGVLVRPSDSLAGHLAAILNAKVSDYWNPNDFTSEKMKLFAVIRSSDNAADDNREEDFSLEVSGDISHEKLFELIGKYYIGKGYEISDSCLPCSISANKGSKFIIVVVTEMKRQIIITVNALKL